jgi:hypothetical protein
MCVRCTTGYKQATHMCRSFRASSLPSKDVNGTHTLSSPHSTTSSITLFPSRHRSSLQRQKQHMWPQRNRHCEHITFNWAELLPSVSYMHSTAVQTHESESPMFQRDGRYNRLVNADTLSTDAIIPEGEYR